MYHTPFSVRALIGLFFSYVRRHVKVLLLFTAFAVIFWGVFFLSGVPAQVVGYAYVLCLSAGIIYLIYGFVRYAVRHRTLCELAGRVEIELAGLPDARDQIEVDYQRLLAALFAARQEEKARTRQAYSELLDYYTLWAHQIKTPISAMRVVLQDDPDEKGQILQLELFEIERYADMVLHYLRMESLSADLLLRSLPLDEIVRQAVRKYAPLFIDKGIQVRLDKIAVCVLSDEKWLLFVIEQVLSNAIKYTPRGGCISFSLDPEREKTLVIRDTGIGIRAEDLPRIFERGFTGYTGRLDKRSTGIGLYLCKKIMDKLSHRIWVCAAPGEGTAVYLGLESIEPLRG